MKCSVSAAGQIHGTFATKLSTDSAVTQPLAAMAVSLTLISGWRISPPTLAASAISASVMTPSSRNAGVVAPHRA